jgi:hypothetical protein
LSNKQLFCVEIDGDDEAVETKDLGENEDEDHADEESRLLGSATDSGVTDNADCIAFKVNNKRLNSMT